MPEVISGDGKEVGIFLIRASLILLFDYQAGVNHPSQDAFALFR
jgi:hypothetical protein